MKELLKPKELRLIEGTRRAVACYRYIGVDEAGRLLIGAFLSDGNRPWPIQSLAAYAGHPRSTVRRRVAGLHEAGLVHLGSGGANLTDAGTDLLVSVLRNVTALVWGERAGFDKGLLTALSALPGGAFTVAPDAETIAFPKLDDWPG